MEIIQTHRNQLIIRHYPVIVWFVVGVFGLMGGIIFCAGSLFGLVFVAFSVLYVTSFGQIVTCIFDKGEGRFTLKRHRVFGTTVIERRIRNISDIQLESDSGENVTYRITIRFTTGEPVSLTDYYSSGITDKQKTVDRIRAFLNLRDSTTDFSGGSRRVDRSPNADPARFVRNRVSEVEALEEAEKAAKRSEMTPEHWKTLVELEKKPWIDYLSDGEPLSTLALLDMEKMGYVIIESWGAGHRGWSYSISLEGRQALADYRASQA